MHKIWFIIISSFFLSSRIFGHNNDWKANLILDSNQLGNLYPSYQDLLVNGKVIKKGEYLCANRFELIRPILDSYNRKFSVLDIGAMEGYFSFRIAEEYDAICTMIEGGSSADKTKLYWWGQEVLYSLCHLNQHLDNIYFLAHKLDLKSLQELNKREHFDIVLVFLVLHMITTNKTLLAKYIDTLLELGNDLIIEMSLDVFPILDDFVHKTCKKKGGKFIGELPRSWDSNLKRKGRFYWFKNPNRIEQEAAPISQKTFEKFNGVYP